MSSTIFLQPILLLLIFLSSIIRTIDRRSRERQFTTLDRDRSDRLVIDTDNLVGHFRVGGGRIEREQAERTFLIVAEQAAVDQFVSMDISQPTTLELVDRVPLRSRGFPGITAMSIGGNNEQAFDPLPLDKTEDLFAFFREPVPRILTAGLDAVANRHVAAEDLEGGVGLAEGIEEPRFLHRPQHRCVLVGPIVAAVEEKEIDVGDRTSEPAARLFRAAAIRRIDKVIAKGLPDSSFPGRMIDCRPSFAIVDDEIVIVPDGKDRRLRDQAAILGSALPAVVAILLCGLDLRRVDVDIVAQG